MPSGFEGWLSIFEDDRVDGSNFNSPQVLFVDKETLAFKKEVSYGDRAIGNSRSPHTNTYILKPKKPQGGITFQFRSEDILKVLYAHFQLGSLEGTAPYRYSFYPRKNGLDWNYFGTWAEGAYGSVQGQPYTVSVLKRLFDVTGGSYLAEGDPAAAAQLPSSFLFKHGVVDKLGFSLAVGQEAQAQANFFFTGANHDANDELTNGFVFSDNPGATTVGSYSALSGFTYMAATVALSHRGNGVDAQIPLSYLTLRSDQKAQEHSRLGAQDPSDYQYGGYNLTGELGFDLPRDAWIEVDLLLRGSAASLDGVADSDGAFSITATLFNGTNDRVCFNIPICKRLPFEFNNPGGDSHWEGKMPFVALEGTTHPIKITVDTDYAFYPLNLFGDGWLGTRDLSVFATYSGELGARTLSEFTFYSRD